MEGSHSLKNIEHFFSKWKIIAVMNFIQALISQLLPHISVNEIHIFEFQNNIFRN